MKKSFFAMAAVALVGCSSHDLVDNSVGFDGQNGKEVPIEFNVQKQNITRAANLETVKHYNFGVFAYKVQGKNGLNDQLVMDNYLVGFGGSGVGYDHTAATTWASGPGTTSDHTSPWFYEGLGTAEYTSPASGYYQASDENYMSKNTHQYLRYWDLAYANTNFYCYAPYNKNVTLTHTQGGTSTLTFPNTNTIRDGYDMPHNSAYNDYSRTLGEFMYAGVNATNASLSDISVPFKHLGAQLFIRFYEDIPGYKVEIIELAQDRGTAVGSLDEKMKGIQAAPSVKSADAPYTYTKGYYYTHSGATINFTEKNTSTSAEWAEGTPTFNWSDDKKVQTPLAFKIPQTDDLYETYSVAPGNLTAYTSPKSVKYNRIKEAGEDSPQQYSYSPTIYYPVAQPQSGAEEYTNSGLTFHVSYRVIAEDNGEVTTVHNATVHVPVSGTATEGGVSGTYPITAWKSNTKYTYTFKITKNTAGTTNPDTDIDPTDPTPGDKKALYPIVFDQATIADYTENVSEYVVSEGTNY